MIMSMFNTVASLFNFSGWEIALITLVILLLFGAKRLPELARGLGKSLKEFKKSTAEVEEEFRSAMNETDHSSSSEKKPKSTENA